MQQAATEQLPPFATVEQLEAYTKGKLRASDPRSLDALVAVSASIRQRAGWHVWPVLTDHALTLDGPGGPVLSIPTTRLLAVHSLFEVGRALDVEEDIDWSATGLVRKVAGGHLDGHYSVAGASWTRRYRKILATIDHGYEDVPELQQLTLQLTARALSSPMGATREQAGSLSVNWGMATQGVSGGLVPLSAESATMERYRWVGY